MMLSSLAWTLNCSQKSSPRRIQCFQSFCKEHTLLKICSQEPTYHHHNGVSSSSIDYFLISGEKLCLHESVKIICATNHPENFSCHDPVFMTLRTPFQSTEKLEKYTGTYTKFEKSKISWKDIDIKQYQKLARSALSYFETFFPSAEFIPVKCRMYSELLVKAAELSTTKLKPRQLHRKNTHSSKVHHAWKHLQKQYCIWKNEGKPRQNECESYLNYKQSRSNFQKVRRHQKRLRMTMTNNQMMYLNMKDKNKFYRLLKTAQGQAPEKPLLELHTPVGTFYGGDTLEGFAADAEFLGRPVELSTGFDNDFRNLCIEDNQHIYELNNASELIIPRMTDCDLNKIIDRELKNGKSCDLYRLTPEHLNNCDEESRSFILTLLNSIIEEMYYLSCPQIKAGLGTAVYKGKKKPMNKSSSYRRITVTPQLGSIIDRYIDPFAEELFQPLQNSEQYGFTKDVNYLMAAIVRGECQRWALDTHQTCFGVSFDGKAAFPSVDRDIQIRELYSCGETGNLLEYSRRTYDNTICQMKQGQLLSREIQEWRGSRQGHKRAAGHFKTYINPCLDSANSSELGFCIGPICISAICVADDTYIVSNDPRKLQGLINIVGHYGKRYFLEFGADKTNVTVTGSKIDMDFYRDINLWTLYGHTLNVTEDNDHLGLIVSGVDEVSKNVEKSVRCARGMLFKLLGNIFAYKCNLSPRLQFHSWQVYIKPVLRSGLSALPLSPTRIKPLAVFHHKILRAILKLSSRSPIAPLYFLLGELPIEATLHLDVLSVFWNI